MSSDTGFVIPTYENLQKQTVAAYTIGLKTNPLISQGVVAVHAKVDAQLAAGLYQHQDYIAKQFFVLWATGKNLDARGIEVDVYRKDPTRSSGTATITGENGAQVAAGQILTATLTGEQYIVTAGATIVAGTAVISLRAVEFGASGNLDAGAQLTFVDTQDRVDVTAVIVEMSGGVDEEQDGEPGVAEHYRGRILEAMQEQAEGGAEADFKIWTKATPDVPVTRVWVYKCTPEKGCTTVRFMVDGDTANGIPTAEQVAAVEAHLEDESPACGEPYAVAPIAKPLNLTITSLSPDTPEIRAAIELELADMLYRKGFPACTIYRNWVTEAIATASGEDSHDGIDLATHFVCGVGEIPVLGTVTYG